MRSCKLLLMYTFGGCDVEVCTRRRHKCCSFAKRHFAVSNALRFNLGLLVPNVWCIFDVLLPCCIRSEGVTVMLSRWPLPARGLCGRACVCCGRGRRWWWWWRQGTLALCPHCLACRGWRPVSVCHLVYACSSPLMCTLCVRTIDVAQIRSTVLFLRLFLRRFYFSSIVLWFVFSIKFFFSIFSSIFKSIYFFRICISRGRR